MRSYIIAYAAAAITFFGMDFAWLSLSMNSVYKKYLGDLLMDKPNIPVAAVFYIFYVVGIVVFCVVPSASQPNWLRPLGYGALFGLLAYGTYDMTNLSTLKGWSPVVSGVDILWGTFATATAAVVSWLVVRHFT